MQFAFDSMLGLGLLACAAGVFWSRDLFRSVVMFIAFGLLLALTWVRLEAPDLALAEAAIGAGLTGVLLLDAIGHLRQHNEHSPRNHWLLPLLCCIALALLLILSFNARPEASISLPQLVAESLPESGVEHPITAVLLNFRSYDTLLEIAVLLVAAVVAMALNDGLAAAARTSTEQSNRDPVLAGFTSRLAPVILLVAIYVLWAGSYMPGGAFQGGAILAAGLVLLKLADFHIERYAESLLRLGLAFGFLVFLAVATSVMIGGRPFLTYPEAFAGQFILFIEAVLTFSIGLILFSLFNQSPGQEVPHDN
ncbi:sodium:proton antiporter [Aliidiomarina sedimenti]|uniref:Sodium:proton antiporter n=1 Tax=Aliidiomarina sedimenti TaxID=1933879 RepID=A0ABY0BYY4_9GAMM|nr:hydrogenase subunit MbhD domain-containing protein [Aliidiomarina sedimenti]RUO29964.1 sodium:proton antiporter [Aliidiomarina sedimenti]